MRFKEWWHYFWRGSIYVYLAPPRRIPLVELYRRAEKFGFDFMGARLDILWFNERLRESAKAGEIVLWGRPVAARTAGICVLDIQKPIPAKHWELHEVNWIGCANLDDSAANGKILSLKKENVYYATHAIVGGTNPYRLRDADAFFDLHIYEVHASNWLRNVPLIPERHE